MAGKVTQRQFYFVIECKLSSMDALLVICYQQFPKSVLFQGLFEAFWYHNPKQRYDFPNERELCNDNWLNFALYGNVLGSVIAHLNDKSFQAASHCCLFRVTVLLTDRFLPVDFSFQTLDLCKFLKDIDFTMGQFQI